MVTFTSLQYFPDVGKVTFDDPANVLGSFFSGDISDTFAKTYDSLLKPKQSGNLLICIIILYRHLY